MNLGNSAARVYQHLIQDFTLGQIHNLCSPKMTDISTDDSSTALINGLHKTLNDLIQNPYPHVPNPPSCKKRASVALIVRVRPSFFHPAPTSPTEIPPVSTSDKTSSDSISEFFAQEWVQKGDPEVLFIKRAARPGDRWTSHVALPGGKRDPEDADDQATAVRETVEEVGLDLTAGDVISVGNLPERVISTTWGKVP